ncbi:MAG: GspH/FimT family protein [Sedimentisphaerales bacterium]|nr:GspH/FimT family protein [Sedimentisphaerales bacterium]
MLKKNQYKKGRLYSMPYSNSTPALLRILRINRRVVCRLSGLYDGFTLIEVIIVIVILAIAAMTAIPMMSSGASMQIRSASNMIAADLEYAKSMAISRGQSYSVVFDESAESYRIKDQAGTVIPHPVKKGFDYIVDFQNDNRLNKVDIANVNFNSADSVVFDCLGSPDNGGTVNLNANGATATITVEPVTGYISISN